jgi:hypothetical protein
VSYTVGVGTLFVHVSRSTQAPRQRHLGRHRGLVERRGPTGRKLRHEIRFAEQFPPGFCRAILCRRKIEGHELVGADDSLYLSARAGLAAQLRKTVLKRCGVPSARRVIHRAARINHIGGTLPRRLHFDIARRESVIDY